MGVTLSFSSFALVRLSSEDASGRPEDLARFSPLAPIEDAKPEVRELVATGELHDIDTIGYGHVWLGARSSLKERRRGEWLRLDEPIFAEAEQWEHRPAALRLTCWLMDEIFAWTDALFSAHLPKALQNSPSSWSPKSNERFRCPAGAAIRQVLSCAGLPIRGTGPFIVPKASWHRSQELLHGGLFCRSSVAYVGSQAAEFLVRGFARVLLADGLESVLQEDGATVDWDGVTLDKLVKWSITGSVLEFSLATDAHKLSALAERANQLCLAPSV